MASVDEWLAKERTLSVRSAIDGAAFEFTPSDELKAALDDRRALEEKVAAADSGVAVLRADLAEAECQAVGAERIALEAREAAEAGWLETAAFSLELAPKGETGLVDLSARLEVLARR